MPNNDVMTFTVENAELIFRNFSGKVTPFNQNGKKTFCVVLDPKSAEQMAKDGWNVKYPKDREEEEQTRNPYIQIEARFDNYPPRVVMITSTSKVNLDDKSIETLDWADIKTADLIARSYDWNVGEKSGIKAFLKTLVVTLEEDELESKYNLNESN